MGSRRRRGAVASATAQRIHSVAGPYRRRRSARWFDRNGLHRRLDGRGRRWPSRRRRSVRGRFQSGSRSRERLADHWPDFLAILRSRLASGSSLDEAFVETADHLGSDFAEIREFVADQLAHGARFDDVLTELRDHLADPLADRVLTTVSAAHASGGQRVSEILASLGMSVADDLRLRKAHEAALTQQRLTAAVALIAPWALLLLTITTNPQAASIYASSSGSSIILLGLAGTGLGYALARRTARLSRAPRLFR